jgi:hypothetical protein
VSVVSSFPLSNVPCLEGALTGTSLSFNSLSALTVDSGCRRRGEILFINPVTMGGD